MWQALRAPAEQDDAAVAEFDELPRGFGDSRRRVWSDARHRESIPLAEESERGFGLGGEPLEDFP